MIATNQVRAHLLSHSLFIFFLVSLDGHWPGRGAPVAAGGGRGMDAEQACIRQRCGWGARGARGLDGGGGGRPGGADRIVRKRVPLTQFLKAPGSWGVLPSPAPYISRHKELFPSFPTPQRARRPVVQGQQPALLLPACPVLADKGVRREGVPSPQRAPPTPSRARPLRRGRSPGARRGPRHQSPARGGGAPAAEARRWTMWTRGYVDPTPTGRHHAPDTATVIVRRGQLLQEAGDS